MAVVKRSARQMIDMKRILVYYCLFQSKLSINHHFARVEFSRGGDN